MSSVINDLNQTTKSKVKKHLELVPKCRNSDRELISLIWAQECLEKQIWNVLDGLRDGRLTNPESIRRERQKLQREYPHLVGNVDALRIYDADKVRAYVRD